MANNKPASAYAKPHNMSGKEITPTASSGPNRSRLDQYNVSIGNINKSAGAGPKTSGIVVRGGKAQTKGKMARGPMA